MSDTAETAGRSITTSLPIRVGHYCDPELKSGTTVILPDDPARAAVHTSGGAPGTRETDLLRPENTVERIDAVVLSGGSAHGLAAADGVLSWLAENGRGFPVNMTRVPIVPAAVIFDLRNGGDKSALPGPGTRYRHSAYREFGVAACQAAARTIRLGSVGAGTGATTANLKGGFGAATAQLSSGAEIAAFAVVNPVGRVTLGDGPHFRAAPFERDGEFGALGWPTTLPADAADPVTKADARTGENTAIAAVVTDLDLSIAELTRLAIAASDGAALAIYPAHAPLDGDTVFALSSAGVDPGPERVLALTEACALAAAAVARAIAVGVHASTVSAGDTLPTWQARFGA